MQQLALPLRPASKKLWTDPVGFSGDAQQSYLTLQFQIEMTPTASNVLFGWWSHDLGGFHNGTLGNRSDVGDEDPKSLVGSEMYLRWLQFGALSPMFRTHVSQSLPFVFRGKSLKEAVPSAIWTIRQHRRAATLAAARTRPPAGPPAQAASAGSGYSLILSR